MSAPAARPAWMFAVERLTSRPGGAERAIRALARALAARGQAVEILMGAGSAPVDGLAAREGRFPLEGGGAAPLISFFAAASPRPDIYYPHGGSWPTWEVQNRAAARGLYRLFQGVRVRLSPRQRAAARDEAALLGGGRPPHVVAIARWVADALERDYGLPTDRIHLVYNGVDTDHFRPDPDLRRRERRRRGWDRFFVCLFAAHNFRLKGLANAVAAAAALRSEPAVRWIVVGKDRPARYRALAARLGCAGRMMFAGAAEDLRPLYAASDLLVQPTFYDPCSLTSLEALATGLPVATSRWNGAAEILRASGGGRVVDEPTDAAGLARAVREIASEDAVALRARARATAERHTEARWVADMMRVMDAVAAAREAGKKA